MGLVVSTRVVGMFAAGAMFAFMLAGCTVGEQREGVAPIVVGTTDQVTSLDPVASHGDGSRTVQTQVFAHLLESVPGSAALVPDLAESAAFTSPTEYTVVLQKGLKWANGNALTASDVKFSFDRQVAIADANGPSALLSNLERTEAADDTSVVFHLTTPNDQTFPGILASQAGIIVDEESFSASKATPDDDIVAANAFSGQYTITKYDVGGTISLAPNQEYRGELGKPGKADVDLTYYRDSGALTRDLRQGTIDAAYGGLSSTDVADLSTDDEVTVTEGPDAEVRSLTFNFNTMPFGAATPDADAAKALAVRQAIAHIVDREAIAEQVYQGTYLPLYSYVPTGVPGAADVLKHLFGDGSGGAAVPAARAVLDAAGVATPVAIDLHYNSDHYGESSDDEYSLIQTQLEETGLFTVTLQSTDWAQYSKDQVADAYPIFQTQWIPWYADADDYLSPFTQGSLLATHYDTAEVAELIRAQAIEPDSAQREADIEQIQATIAQNLPTLPLLQRAQIVATGNTVTGATLDSSYTFRFATMRKS
jgi:peptide/nickel transport system substrate-binding protein